MLFLLIQEQNISIDLGQNEHRGVEYIKPFRQLLYDIQKHQVAFLSGAAEAFATERQILEDIRSAQEVDGSLWKRVSNNPRPCWISAETVHNKTLDSSQFQLRQT